MYIGQRTKTEHLSLKVSWIRNVLYVIYTHLLARNNTNKYPSRKQNNKTKHYMKITVERRLSKFNY